MAQRIQAKFDDDNQRNKNAALLDAGFGVSKSERVIFSAKTGMGRDNLLQTLDSFLV